MLYLSSGAQSIIYSYYLFNIVEIAIKIPRLCKCHAESSLLWSKQSADTLSVGHFCRYTLSVQARTPEQAEFQVQQGAWPASQGSILVHL